MRKDKSIFLVIVIIALFFNGCSRTIVHKESLGKIIDMDVISGGFGKLEKSCIKTEKGTIVISCTSVPKGSRGLVS